MRRREKCMMLFTVIWTVVILYWTSTINIGGEQVSAEVVTTLAPTEEVIVQRIPPKKARFTVEQEIDMACAEVDCVKKCTVSYGDKKEKFDLCRKNCAKERCKERCKNEPNPSYVERELKREKCLDRCTDKDEKCKTACENDAKKCKDRCKERSQKFFCVRDLDKLGQDDDEPVLDASHFENDDLSVI